MNKQRSKKLIALTLLLCILVSIFAVLPIHISAAISTSNNYFFKVGASSALANGTRKSPIEEPFEDGGVVYIPVSSLTTVMGSDPAGGVVTVNGIQAVALNSIGSAYSGYYGSISNMSLIAISKTQNLLSSTNYSDDEDEIALMKKFLFDNISSTDGSTQVSSFEVADVKSTDHPYLYANQSKFDELAAVYAAGKAGEAVDDTLYGYIENRLSYAKSLYDQYAQVDASGNYLAMNTQVNLARGHQDYIFEIPYQTTGGTGGYDVGGRLNEASSNTVRIQALAFAYQLTKDINYAKLAYQYAIYIGQWEHWGPGHFLNAADAMGPYAIAYDWLYDAWAELASEGATYLYFNGTYSTSGTPQFETRTVSLAAIQEVLFTHGLIPAYYANEIPSGSKTSTSVPWWSKGGGVGGWDYVTDTNNWNAVCSAGTTLAALALIDCTTSASGTKIDTTVDGVYNAQTDYTTYLSYEVTTSGSICGTTTETVNIAQLATYQEYAVNIINKNLWGLPLYGLGQYIADGSYIESNGYWDYGTNNLYEMAAALTSATGSHYGLLDAWGMDTTVYYALNTMSSDGLGYNYHDSSTTGPQNTEWFLYLSTDAALGDDTLAGIRKDLNENVKQNPSMYDILFYRSDDDIGEFEYPALQYWMEGIDGYVVRDSWNPEEGSLYAAFMGEGNNITHGQVDSGAFVYYNKGTRWFCDLGTEEYNAYNFWTYPYRARYYAMGPEGNNTVIIKNHESDDFFGQGLYGGGELTKQGNNEYGAYAVIDNTTAYALYNLDSNGKPTSIKSNYATTALRGIMLTNDRKTFVIQDQLTFSSAQSVAWIGHTVSNVDIMLSVDGKVAYMSDGTSVMKVTLIDYDNAGLSFRVSDASDESFLLNNTNKYTYSEDNGGVAQKDYSDYKKLLVEADNVTKFNIAIVIEEVIPGETMNDAQGVGYSWVDMNSWSVSNVTSDNRSDGSVDSGDDTDPSAVGTVTVTPVSKDENLDTPIVDLYSYTSAVSYAALPADETADEPVTYTAYSFEELQKYINDNSGSLIEVDLKASNSTPIDINAACIVNTNGNKLLATSASYIAQVSGNTVEYKKGSVSVKWILANGATVTEVYTGASVASYKGSISDGSDIYEIDNGDGTFSYYTSGNAWSLTENGKQAKDSELIVTSENNVFYQTGLPFDGLFVTVKGNTITGYYNPADFFKSNILSGGFDRVSVTSDFAYDATNNKNGEHIISKNFNLYLNGYTITYTSSDTSDHMFSPSGNTVNNFYGPGGLKSEAGQSNIALTSGTNTFYNIDIYSTRAVIDHRNGTTTFKNCSIIIEDGTYSAIGIINRNNQESSIPTVIVDGCRIDMPYIKSTVSVFSIQSNGIMEVTGGTTVNAANAQSLFSINNATVWTSASDTSKVAAYDFTTGCAKAQAIVGEVYHNCKEVAYYTVGYDVDSNGDGKFDAWTGGSIESETIQSYMPTSANLYYGNTYKSQEDPKDLNLVEGVKVVRTDDANFPYILAKDGYATVIWMNGSTTLGTEYWLAGTTPVASEAIKEEIGTIASGKMISFDTDRVVAGSTYTFAASVIDSFGLKVNMSLHSDFNLNFFIENIGEMIIKIDGVVVTPDTEAMEGYYKVSKTGINPAMAGKSVKLEVTYGGATVTKSISPIAYAEKILAAGTWGEEAEMMMINMVKYIEAAYLYVGNNVNEYAADYQAVRSLYSKYKDIATVAVVDRQGVDMSNVNDAIGGAQLNLVDSPRFRFNLKSSYTGTVIINGTEYTVTDGTYGGKSYIEIGFKAYDMLDEIEITTAKGTATYTLANYYYYEAVEFGNLSNLLNALFAYCETAKIYKVAYPNN